MQIFKKINTTIFVEAPIVETYLPFEYGEKELYQIIGEDVKYFGVANFKVFENEKQLDNRKNIKTIPYGIAAFLLARPSEKDVADVQFTEDSYVRKCIILRFYKGDQFIVNTNIIKSPDHMSILLGLLENGKLDNIPATCITDVIKNAQKLNGINLRMPEEYIRVLVAERYRDPENSRRQLRYSNNTDSYNIVTTNPREETMMSSTFQGITFEDINKSIIVACNRKDEGLQEEEALMEKIIKGEKIQ